MRTAGGSRVGSVREVAGVVSLRTPEGEPVDNLLAYVFGEWHVVVGKVLVLLGSGRQLVGPGGPDHGYGLESLPDFVGFAQPVFVAW